MNLDISTGVQTAFFIALAAVVISLIIGIRTIQAGNKLLFFRKRRDLVVRGWRMIGFSVFLGGLAFLINRYAEPVAYQIFPPSPTVTLTSTVTETSTVTLTPTISPTPTITPTISITPSPYIPTNIFVQFTSVVTPNPAAIFSKPQIAKELSKDRTAANPAIEFANPVGHLYAAFSYDKMTDKSQWTAIWVRLTDNTIICFESKPWDGCTGGYGYADCEPSSEKWQPGDYMVEIFVGVTYKIGTNFSVTGIPPTSTITLTLTSSLTLTHSVTPTSPTSTPTPSYTPTALPPTWTPVPSATSLSAKTLIP